LAEGLSGERSSRSQESLVQRSSWQETRVYRWRFGLAYLALAVIAGAGVGTAIMLLGRPDKAPEPAWASWHPTGRESTFPAQIADYVSGRYRLASGRALVGVIAGKPEVQGVSVAAVAIQNDPEGESDDISIVRTDDAEMFVLCGLGDACAINEGRASEERHLLLRREALELALYTFKYVDGVDSVIALLPPRPPQNENDTPPSTALFFQKKDFGKELDRPLTETLLRGSPPQVVEVDPQEGFIVERLTTPHLFQYEFRQAQEGSAVMVLAPLVTQP
jgi:hypothetical protein